jgi:hypothetical protein
MQPAIASQPKGKYYIVVYSYTDAQTAEVATADAPYHFEASAASARRSGNVSVRDVC